MDHDSVLLPLPSIRVDKKQHCKVSDEKVKKHIRQLEEAGGELYPVDVHELGDGSYAIAGNGRHRYFAYLYAGYSHIPAVIRNPQPETASHVEVVFYLTCK